MTIEGPARAIYAIPTAQPGVYKIRVSRGRWQISGINTTQHGVPLAVTDGTSNNGGLNWATALRP